MGASCGVSSSNAPLFRDHVRIIQHASIKTDAGTVLALADVRYISVRDKFVATLVRRFCVVDHAVCGPD